MVGPDKLVGKFDRDLFNGEKKVGELYGSIGVVFELTRAYLGLNRHDEYSKDKFGPIDIPHDNVSDLLHVMDIWGEIGCDLWGSIDHLSVSRGIYSRTYFHPKHDETFTLPSEIDFSELGHGDFEKLMHIGDIEATLFRRQIRLEDSLGRRLWFKEEHIPQIKAGAMLYQERKDSFDKGFQHRRYVDMLF